MTAVVHANLDCEATWAGIALPLRVQHRISAASALLAALAPDADAPCEVWAPAAVEPGALLASPGWRPPVMRIGTPPHADVVWADPAARAANDRRLALAIGAAAGAALPGACTIASLGELDRHLATRDPTEPWVCKAVWTSAGRDRCHGRGPAVGEARVRLGRLLDRFGALSFEPWLDRILDVGTCATVSPAGVVTARPPHELVTDARGGFLGIRLAPPALTTAERDRAGALVDAAGRALAALGYAGPFAVDAFAYRDGDARRFHALCEINARYTFGWVAHALAARLGCHTLGFGPSPPGATVLVRSEAVMAWVA